MSAAATRNLGPMGVPAADFDWERHAARAASFSRPSTKELAALQPAPARRCGEPVYGPERNPAYPAMLTRRAALARDARQSPKGVSVDSRGSVANAVPKLPNEVVKWSRRMRRIAADVLRGEAPRTVEQRNTPREDGTVDDAGRWYPVCACGTTPHSAAISITAMQRSSGAVSWAGLMRCGSVWTCAECAQTIEAVRSKELLRLIESARAKGFVIVMITHTFPHEREHTCLESMEGLSLSVRKMRQDGSYQNLRKKLGFVGLARKREVTIGWNGYHPHDHELWVCDPVEATIDIVAMSAPGQSYKDDHGRSKFGKSELETLVKDKVYPIWAKCAARIFGADRVPTIEHGLDASIIWNATDYLAKCPERAARKAAEGKKRWGADAEMGKTTVKKGRRGSRTPWEILEIAGGNCPSFEEQKAAGQRCVTIAEAREIWLDYCRGTWRKRAMYWTPTRTKKDGTVVLGLRDRFGLGEELTDEQIVAGELPMTQEQEQREKDKADPVMVHVEFDLYSMGSLGRRYVDALQERASHPDTGSIVVLARRDGWKLERIEDHPSGAARWSAVHPEARRDGIRRGYKVEKADPDCTKHLPKTDPGWCPF